MKLLAIETATDTCSVALGHDGAVIEHFEQAARRQTARVLPMVDALLAEAGVALRQLDAIAFSRGPGAFTGVRVSVSVAQGLGYAADLPLLGISTLATCAAAASARFGAGPWLVAQDARMGELYLGAYEPAADGDLRVLLEDRLCDPGALAGREAAGWRGVGSGAPFSEAIRQAFSGLGEWREDVGPRAGAMIPLARAAWRRGEAVGATAARPVYLRNQVIQGAVR